MKRRTLFAKVARITLGIYLVAITGLVVAAVTVGPFREPLQLWSKIRVLESDLRESERLRKPLEEEKNRLLAAVKKLQSDWNTQQETIRALRELIKNPESEQRLVEANRISQKLSQERSVLIAKLNQLRQEIRACAEAEAELKKLKEK